MGIFLEKDNEHPNFFSRAQSIRQIRHLKWVSISSKEWLDTPSPDTVLLFLQLETDQSEYRF